MPRYYPDLLDALDKVKDMTQEEMLNYIDDLYGRDNLKFGDPLPQIRNELERQVRKDFEMPRNEEDDWIDAMAQVVRRGY